MVIILLLGGGGFFAWQQGLVDQVGDTVKQAGDKVKDLVVAQLPDKVETAPVMKGGTGSQDTLFTGCFIRFRPVLSGNPGRNSDICARTGISGRRICRCIHL